MLHHWNYRVLKSKPDDPDLVYPYYWVGKVHYNEEGKPEAYTTLSPVINSENFEELQKDVMAMVRAFDKPVLEAW